MLLHLQHKRRQPALALCLDLLPRQPRGPLVVAHQHVRSLRDLDLPRQRVLAHPRRRHDRVPEDPVELAAPPQYPRAQFPVVQTAPELEGAAREAVAPLADVVVPYAHELLGQLGDGDAHVTVRVDHVVKWVPRVDVLGHDHIVLPHVLDLEAVGLLHGRVEEGVDVVELVEKVLRVVGLHGPLVERDKHDGYPLEVLQQRHRYGRVQQPGREHLLQEHLDAARVRRELLAPKQRRSERALPGVPHVKGPRRNHNRVEYHVDRDRRRPRDVGVGVARDDADHEGHDDEDVEGDLVLHQAGGECVDERQRKVRHTYRGRVHRVVRAGVECRRAQRLRRQVELVPQPYSQVEDHDGGHVCDEESVVPFADPQVGCPPHAQDQGD
mmetsp:Transcript_41077/g.100174  ORF Transcript_41077/g.100174 Transcript_41077/m.100174 type:complete len:382 (-) Transcript_41077:281-1426(-)